MTASARAKCHGTLNATRNVRSAWMYSENIFSFLMKSLISKRLGAMAPGVSPPRHPVVTTLFLVIPGKGISLR